MPQPQNKALYAKVIAAAKKKFSVWPSAYASGWVVQEYKRRGGKYAGSKRSRSPLKRWYDEKWVDVCYLPRIVPCGRKSASPHKYPYCRPLRRLSKKTPKTAREISKSELRRRCSLKRSNPRRRVTSRRIKRSTRRK